jgi:hypothetical protein
VTLVKEDLKDFKAKLDQLGLKVSKDLLDLEAYLVKQEPEVLRGLLVQLDHRAQQDRKGFRGKLAPEERLVRKAIEASLALQEPLAQLDRKDQED